MRFDVRFRQPPDAARAFHAFSVNLSANGLCLRSAAVHVVGERLALHLTVEDEVFELMGVVAWVRGEAVGVRFEDLRPAQRERLDALARTPLAPP